MAKNYISSLISSGLSGVRDKKRQWIIVSAVVVLFIVVFVAVQLIRISVIRSEQAAQEENFAKLHAKVISGFQPASTIPQDVKNKVLKEFSKTPVKK